MTTHAVEIRTYNLKPGTRAVFDQRVHDEALPMLLRWKVDVVACGCSPHDDDTYYLVRAYASLAAREQSQDAFYSSAQWLDGPREGIVDLIASYTSVVLMLDDATLAGLRRAPVESAVIEAHAPG